MFDSFDIWNDEDSWMRVFAVCEVRNVRSGGCIVLRAKAVYPRIEVCGKVAVSNRFSEFYSKLSGDFINWCVEVIGNEATAEFKDGGIQSAYGFCRYECICEFTPELCKAQGEDRSNLLKVSRHTQLLQRGKIEPISANEDYLLWNLPSLTISRSRRKIKDLN